MATLKELATIPKRIRDLRLELNDRQGDFADRLLAGESKASAYRIAYNDQATPFEAANGGFKISIGKAVTAYINSVKEHIWANKALKRSETLAYLGDAVRVTPADLMDDAGTIKPEYAHLIQEVKRDENGITSIKTVSKTECARLSAAMQGHLAPVETKGTLTLATLIPQDAQVEGEW